MTNKFQNNAISFCKIFFYFCSHHVLHIKRHSFDVFLHAERERERDGDECMKL